LTSAQGFVTVVDGWRSIGHGKILMKKIIIFGTQNFAQIAHYYFTQDSERSVAAFTVDAAFFREPTFCGLPVVTFEEVERHFSPADYDMFVAVGHQKLNTQRSVKVAEAEAKGYRLASFVSSRAIVPPDLEVRPNTMIMEGAVLFPFVEVGRDTIIWGRSSIGPSVKFGEHCWIVTPLLGESVIVGDHSFIGLGATIAPGKKIGKSNVIGAGALIMKDTKDFEIYRGHASVPSRAPSYRLGRI
jgi:sugar O-acyltransferase (sialic acid O-acetyltransferase NeuD family)